VAFDVRVRGETGKASAGGGCRVCQSEFTNLVELVVMSLDTIDR